MTNRTQPESQISTNLPAQHEIAVETGRQAYATLDMRLDQNDLGDQELTGDDVPPVYDGCIDVRESITPIAVYPKS